MLLQQFVVPSAPQLSPAPGAPSAQLGAVVVSPAQPPAVHVPVAHGQGSPHRPSTLQMVTCDESTQSCVPGVHAPASAPELADPALLLALVPDLVLPAVPLVPLVPVPELVLVLPTVPLVPVAELVLPPCRSCPI